LRVLLEVVEKAKDYTDPHVVLIDTGYFKSSEEETQAFNQSLNEIIEYSASFQPYATSVAQPRKTELEKK
jgi:hypothetical protein